MYINNGFFERKTKVYFYINIPQAFVTKIGGKL